MRPDTTTPAQRNTDQETRQLCPERRPRGPIPFVHRVIGGPMKHLHVNRGQEHHGGFQPKKDVAVEPHRLAVEKCESRGRH